jgi:hypothetical protein
MSLQGDIIKEFQQLFLLNEIHTHNMTRAFILL